MCPTSQDESRPRGRADLQSVELRGPAIEHDGVQRAVYEVQQHFRYVYDAPIFDLKQRLVVIPRPLHGDQRVLSYRVETSQPTSSRRTCPDRFGNTVSEIEIATVEEVVDFDVSLVVERSVGRGPHLETVSRTTLNAYREPSALTEPDQALRTVAATLADQESRDGVDLAIAVGGWVYRHMRYGFDLTGPSTTAGQALAAGQGVCQDYAHLMVALCRLLDIPARYVSGHLLGEGGTHAWVEVLQPAAGELLEITAWDPTHDRPTDNRYLSVAAGRDYRDVAPVSGVYRGTPTGQLSTSRCMRLVTALDEIAA